MFLISKPTKETKGDDGLLLWEKNLEIRVSITKSTTTQGDEYYFLCLYLSDNWEDEKHSVKPFFYYTRNDINIEDINIDITEIVSDVLSRKEQGAFFFEPEVSRETIQMEGSFETLKLKEVTPFSWTDNYKIEFENKTSIPDEEIKGLLLGRFSNLNTNLINVLSEREKVMQSSSTVPKEENNELKCSPISEISGFTFATLAEMTKGICTDDYLKWLDNFSLYIKGERKTTEQFYNIRKKNMEDKTNKHSTAYIYMYTHEDTIEILSFSYLVFANNNKIKYVFIERNKVTYSKRKGFSSNSDSIKLVSQYKECYRCYSSSANSYVFIDDNKEFIESIDMLGFIEDDYLISEMSAHIEYHILEFMIILQYFPWLSNQDKSERKHCVSQIFDQHYQGYSFRGANINDLIDEINEFGIEESSIPKFIFEELTKLNASYNTYKFWKDICDYRKTTKQEEIKKEEFLEIVYSLKYALIPDSYLKHVIVNTEVIPIKQIVDIMFEDSKKSHDITN